MEKKWKQRGARQGTARKASVQRRQGNWKSTGEKVVRGGDNALTASLGGEKGTAPMVGECGRTR